MWMMFVEVASAGNYFVNNRSGRDQNDGLSEVALNALTGPVRSINRALELAGSGDAVHVADTGTPYYESLSLVGARHSGAKNVPFTIYGNNAVISGLRQLPSKGWREASDGIWQVSFNRKGYYFLLRDGVALPEHRGEASANILETLPPGQWCAFRGAVFYRPNGFVIPTQDRFDYAADEMGITLYQVEHVKIVDLTVQHFRVDGVNAHNMCVGITLENVTSRENGRAGLAAGGTSSVTLLNSKLLGNGRDSALITGKASLDVRESELDVEPSVRP
jgi:hypothetical protein